VEHDPSGHVLRGYPKKELADVYRDVLIEVDAGFNMRRLVVSYPDHSRMEFEFSGTERNVALPRSLFEFTPPPGTEIINQRGGGLAAGPVLTRRRQRCIADRHRQPSSSEEGSCGNNAPQTT